MALFGKIEFTILHPTTGLPVPSATIQMRKQGATAQGTTGPNAITVHTPGGILVGESLVLDATTTPVRTVTAVAATQIDVSGLGFIGIINDVTRLSVETPTPTVYNAEDGAEAVAGATLTTDANGYAVCYAVQGPYDARVSGGGLTPYLLTDIPCVAGGRFSTHIFPSGGGTAAWDFDTSRALSGTDLIARFLNAGVLKASIRQDGVLTVTGISTSGALTITGGGISVTGGVTVVTGGVSITAGGLTLGASGGVITQSQTTGTNTLATDLQLTSKDLRVRHIRANQGTAMTTGDISLGSGWGTGPAVTSVTNARNTAGRVRITTGTGPSGNADFTINLKDGGMQANAHCIVQRAGGTINSAIGMVALIVCTATTVTVSVVGALAASTAYDWEWVILDGA